MTQHEPNTQGDTWEEVRACITVKRAGDQFGQVDMWALDIAIKNLLSKERVKSEERELKLLRDIERLVKERAEGERRERARILAALPTKHTNSAGLMRRFLHGSPSEDWMDGYSTYRQEARKAITTLPADSTEKV